MKIKHWIDLGVLGEDVDIVVWYDYQPKERQTAYYPGCDEKIEITSFEIEGLTTSEELDNIILDSLNANETLLDKIHNYELERGQ